MTSISFRRLAGVALALAFLAALAPRATADNDYLPPVRDPIVAKECRACHMLYPVGGLTAVSWQRMMAGLSNHFGENAEIVDLQVHAHILAYLTANAAKPARGAKPLTLEDAPLRISELDWFKRKHNKKDRIAPATLARRGAKSPADCLPCHKRGEAGDFD